MFRKCLIALMFTVALSFSAAAAEFSTVIEDLPLMPGMVEKAEAAIVFDKPGGRIVETTAQSAATPAAVKNFYAAALPPLGWTAVPGGYIRTGEKLTITPDGTPGGTPGGTMVHFKITPEK